MIYNFLARRNISQGFTQNDVYGQSAARNCHNRGIQTLLVLAGSILIGFMSPGALFAHGGVVMEEDQCVIDIGLFRAHFTIYQPESSASEEFCEDVPDLGETIFVMDYLHDSLNQMPVDFRIIRDVDNKRTYAAWEDVDSIADLEAATVYYQAAMVEPSGSLSAKYDFEHKGWYIGIVTTRQAGSEKIYRAVFGFHVGGQGYGFWPLLVLIAVLAQLSYWLSGGGWKRLQSRRGRHPDTGTSE